MYGSLARSTSLAVAYILTGALLVGCSTARGVPVVASGVSQTSVMRSSSGSQVASLADSLTTMNAQGKTGPGQRVSTWIHSVGAATLLIYISDSVNNAVYIFKHDGTQVGQLGGLFGPGGLFVDRSHNLWIANDQANDILVFPRGGTSPIATYYDSNGPLDVTVCPNGTIYASNLSYTPGSISIYVPGTGSPYPTGTLQDPKEDHNFFLTCDANNNVFTTITLSASPSSGAVDEYVGGKQSGIKRLPITLGYPGGIKPDGAGKLLISDEQGSTVTEYTEAGVPTGGSISTAPDHWGDIAVMRNVSAVLGADYTVNAGKEVLFPSGTLRHTYSYGGSQVVGVAYDPGQ